jgi:hypothetical protein
MDQKFRTSFIPKQEVIRSEVRRPTAFRLSIFSIIAMSLFGLAVILAIVIFVWQRSLVSYIDKMNDDLVAVRLKFEPKTVDTLVRLDHRIESGKKILASHNGMEPVLKFLEDETLKDIRYKNLEYTYDLNGKMKITMGGEARNFLTIASQSALWSGEHRVVNPLFNDLNVDEKDFARFSFQSSLDPTFFLYKSTLAGFEAPSSAASSTPDGGIRITPVNSNGGILPSEQ